MQKKILPLIEVFGNIVDERNSKGKRYSLVSILTLCFVAMTCGYRKYSAIAEFCRNYQKEMSECLGLGRRSPCAATIYNVLRKVGVKKFESVVSEWVESFLESEEELAIDGKTLRGTKKQGGKFYHLLSAFSGRLGITLHQIPVDKKTNEIGAIIELLSELVLEGRIITMDALLTQRKVAETIISEKADYVMLAKDNQERLRKEIKAVIEVKELWKPNIETFETIEKRHGRIERRKITVTESEIVDWPGVEQIFRVEREVIRKGKDGMKLTSEVIYGLTSLPKERTGAERLLRINRGHWSIENRSHWVRDVTFDEDRTQIKDSNLAQLMALIRNIVIGIIRFEGFNNIAEAFRFYAANPFNALALIMLRIK